ncbi:hypothetical protein V500_11560 [Pseudogymnoascus sp. VKM F-4518 (FW-2643)]|nr:hypothetical protein V500_11560 [Pseudogymnoascus sp. VKM F-4518 (FW-2643)]
MIAIFIGDVYVNGARIRTLLLALLWLYAATGEGRLPVRRRPAVTPYRRHGARNNELICTNELSGTGAAPPQTRLDLSSITPSALAVRKRSATPRTNGWVLSSCTKVAATTVRAIIDA